MTIKISVHACHICKLTRMCFFQCLGPLTCKKGLSFQFIGQKFKAPMETGVQTMRQKQDVQQEHTISLFRDHHKWLSSSISSRSYSMKNKSCQKSLKYWGWTLSSSSISCLKYCSSSGHLGWANFRSRSISFILHSFQHWKHRQHISDRKAM